MTSDKKLWTFCVNHKHVSWMMYTVDEWFLGNNCLDESVGKLWNTEDACGREPSICPSNQIWFKILTSKNWSSNLCFSLHPHPTSICLFLHSYLIIFLPTLSVLFLVFSSTILSTSCPLITFHSAQRVLNSLGVRGLSCRLPYSFFSFVFKNLWLFEFC